MEVCDTVEDHSVPKKRERKTKDVKSISESDKEAHKKKIAEKYSSALCRTEVVSTGSPEIFKSDVKVSTGSVEQVNKELIDSNVIKTMSEEEYMHSVTSSVQDPSVTYQCKVSCFSSSSTAIILPGKNTNTLRRKDRKSKVGQNELDQTTEESSEVDKSKSVQRYDWMTWKTKSQNKCISKPLAVVVSQGNGFEGNKTETLVPCRKTAQLDEDKQSESLQESSEIDCSKLSIQEYKWRKCMEKSDIDRSAEVNTCTAFDPTENSNATYSFDNADKIILTGNKLSKTSYESTELDRNKSSRQEYDLIRWKTRVQWKRLSKPDLLGPVVIPGMATEAKKPEQLGHCDTNQNEKSSQWKKRNQSKQICKPVPIVPVLLQVNESEEKVTEFDGNCDVSSRVHEHTSPSSETANATHSLSPANGNNLTEESSDLDHGKPSAPRFNRTEWIRKRNRKNESKPESLTPVLQHNGSQTISFESCAECPNKNQDVLTLVPQRKVTTQGYNMKKGNLKRKPDENEPIVPQTTKRSEKMELETDQFDDIQNIASEQGDNTNRVKCKWQEYHKSKPGTLTSIELQMNGSETIETECSGLLDANKSKGVSAEEYNQNKCEGRRCENQNSQPKALCWDVLQVDGPMKTKNFKNRDGNQRKSQVLGYDWMKWKRRSLLLKSMRCTLSLYLSQIDELKVMNITCFGSSDANKSKTFTQANSNKRKKRHYRQETSKTEHVGSKGSKLISSDAFNIVRKQQAFVNSTPEPGNAKCSMGHGVKSNIVKVTEKKLNRFPEKSSAINQYKASTKEDSWNRWKTRFRSIQKATVSRMNESKDTVCHDRSAAFSSVKQVGSSHNDITGAENSLLDSNKSNLVEATKAELNEYEEKHQNTTLKEEKETKQYQIGPDRMNSITLQTRGSEIMEMEFSDPPGTFSSGEIVGLSCPGTAIKRKNGSFESVPENSVSERKVREHNKDSSEIGQGPALGKEYIWIKWKTRTKNERERELDPWSLFPSVPVTPPACEFSSNTCLQFSNVSCYAPEVESPSSSQI